MMLRANPLFPLPPFHPRPFSREIASAIDSTSVTSISDNSRCMHVRRIYTARKAELCPSNINTIPSIRDRAILSFEDSDIFKSKYRILIKTINYHTIYSDENSWALLFSFIGTLMTVSYRSFIYYSIFDVVLFSFHEYVK